MINYFELLLKPELIDRNWNRKQWKAVNRFLREARKKVETLMSIDRINDTVADLMRRGNAVINFMQNDPAMIKEEESLERLLKETE